jgi:hypothetical protein
MPRIHIDDALFQRASQAAAKAGFSHVEELIRTAVEREIARVGDDDAESQVADQLRGLGYIE